MKIRNFYHWKLPAKFLSSWTYVWISIVKTSNFLKLFLPFDSSVPGPGTKIFWNFEKNFNDPLAWTWAGLVQVLVKQWVYIPLVLSSEYYQLNKSVLTLAYIFWKRCVKVNDWPVDKYARRLSISCLPEVLMMCWNVVRERLQIRHFSRVIIVAVRLQWYKIANSPNTSPSFITFKIRWSLFWVTRWRRNVLSHDLWYYPMEFSIISAVTSQ